MRTYVLVVIALQTLPAALVNYADSQSAVSEIEAVTIIIISVSPVPATIPATYCSP